MLIGGIIGTETPFRMWLNKNLRLLVLFNGILAIGATIVRSILIAADNAFLPLFLIQKSGLPASTVTGDFAAALTLATPTARLSG